MGARQLDGVAAGYRACEAITRWRAANFYYGIRLLPPRKRRALCAVYAFARRIDDVGDDEAANADKAAGLARARTDLAALQAGTAPAHDPVLLALADASAAFALPLDAFADLLDGVEMDVAGATYESVDDLILYCRRVAGSIGRLSLGVFGSSDPPTAEQYADQLGVALQLTNILRDLREDRDAGRTYLPAVDRRRFECAPDLSGPPDQVSALVRFEAGRAREWFARGLRLLPLLDRRSAACVAAMAGIYRRLLGRIEREPIAVLRERVSLPAWEKALVAARSLARGAA